MLVTVHVIIANIELSVNQNVIATTHVAVAQRVMRLIHAAGMAEVLAIMKMIDIMNALVDVVINMILGVIACPMNVVATVSVAREVVEVSLLVILKTADQSAILHKMLIMLIMLVALMSATTKLLLIAFLELQLLVPLVVLARDTTEDAHELKVTQRNSRQVKAVQR